MQLGRQAAELVGVPFEVTVTAQSAGAYKPEPEPYRQALDALALPAERVLFVAGSPYDISGAGAAGMDVWWHNRARHAPPARTSSGRRAPLARAAPRLCVLAAVGPLRCDLRGDDAPGDGDTAAELAEPRRGADDDTEPAGADVPAAGGHVNAGELVAAQLGDASGAAMPASAARSDDPALPDPGDGLRGRRSPGRLLDSGYPVAGSHA